MKNNYNKYVSPIAIILILLIVVGATYAYIRNNVPNGGQTDIVVSSNTTDQLSFTISNDIEFRVSQEDFAPNADNKSGEATLSVTLTPNNKTYTASSTFNVYLRLNKNETVYSRDNGSKQPELMVTIFEKNWCNNNTCFLSSADCNRDIFIRDADETETCQSYFYEINSHNELGYSTIVNDVRGYDITNLDGPIPLLVNQAITADGHTQELEYKVVITLINHDFNQNDNAGKEISGSIIITKEDMPYCPLFPDNPGCKLDLSYSPYNTPNIELENGGVYYHGSLPYYSAKDGSYRYAGKDPNNYVCFGSIETPCPESNLYRIIGLIPVDVVTDDSTTPVKTEQQLLYKLIKNDYITGLELGMTSTGNATKASNYKGYSGNAVTGNVPGFNFSSGTWSQNNLNNDGLNGSYLENMGDVWSDKIANVMWKIGGNYQIYNYSPANAYKREITYSGVNIDNTSSFYAQADNKKEIANKVGLMYVSDYGYAAPSSIWYTELYRYNGNDYSQQVIKSNNWLYRGVNEYTITMDTSNTGKYHYIHNGGIATSAFVSSNSLGIRPVFYLKETENIDMTNYDGTKEEPYRIACENCYTVTFDLDGGTGTLTEQTVEAGSKAHDWDSAPTKDYYSFGGWQLNNAPYDFDTPVNSDITLTALWIPVTTSGSGYIYHHDATLTNGAGDGSYRYAGTNPNNYICFGSDAAECPANNLYRIIGQIPVDVVVNETNPNNPIIETQVLYKLIKNDYETTTSLGISIGTNGSSVPKASSYAGPNENQPSGTIQGFSWYQYNDNNNTIGQSVLSTTGLNTNAYGTFDSTWQAKIAKVMWKVGGNTSSNISSISPMSKVYTNEIINPVATNTQDNKTEIANKIGLMYASDYGYAAAPQSSWKSRLSNYNSFVANNWLYKGVNEWTMTRESSNSTQVFEIVNSGYITAVNSYNGYGVRRVFYLTENTVINMNDYTGTKGNPYRIS